MHSFRRRPLASLICALLIGSAPHSVLAATPAVAVTPIANATASTNATHSATAKATGTDPLFRYQWHLLNQGQPVFGDQRPRPGVDLDVDVLHTLGIRGAGVKVAVIDDGLEIAHEDLVDNIVAGGSHNFLNGSNDPTPPADEIDTDHGTAVAGIIAARGWNGLGGRGVAPEAQLAGFNALSESDGSKQYVDVRYAWGDGPEARAMDVFNNSFGVSTAVYPFSDLDEQRSLEKLMRAQRGGKGGIYVKSAGNDFNTLIDVDAQGKLIDRCSDQTRQLGVACSSANIDNLNSLTTMIVVGAVNANGVRASYSSPGSSLWVSGLSGEFGFQRRFDPHPETFKELYTLLAKQGPQPFFSPAIVTTDLSGCAAGNNRDRTRAPQNALDTSHSKIDASCKYTARMNGTSASAPTVAGVAALMLSANPQLTLRDVKYILATTAVQVDPNQAKVFYKDTVIEPAWITNAAGHRFSNWYGFGLVDAAAAVERAVHFTPLPAMQDTEWTDYDGKSSTIGGIGSPARLAIDIKQSFKVEGVQLYFSGTHKNPRNLRAVLVSPSGTRSTLMTPFSTLDSGDGFVVFLTSSNAFLDEPSAGRWTLEVDDMLADNGKAQLQEFEMRVVGH
ncbi:serine protease [Xanthomonas vasicola]|nr:S8 family peptidase [Xanthomonas vasicola]AZR30461.1 serine protease [Xanthomonas vasicola pv. musacearum NCPPB 4379]KFA07606.1 serine protease [Xanthomonas vasicola pv. musacearum NCPPB 2005]KFA09722.1 serine protease [Xanthomonas vasicola pv. musacearum NCPPB 4380]KFA16582.1 serine protease [Xanthomonas vasicola pv. musacearum NCPPB 4394]KFA17746.1 serine protease [Xanthomonas vasicola pv. musacearum NCPPB 4392]KFA19576.1 serine protease [Xanthomonas vasicola pv. musacearum NCPPB 4384]M